MDIRKIFTENRILAILRNIPADRVLDYVQAVADGGVKLFEVALNSPDALREISAIRERFGDSIYLGAGTVTEVEAARRAVAAGAQFLLSPSTDEAVLSYCEAEGIPMLPGALTPSDVSACLRHGFDTVKLFPAGDMPAGYIKSLRGPFPEVSYVAIGGVNRENMRDFLDNGYIAVGLGSNLLPREAAETLDWAACSRYVAGMTVQIAGLGRQDGDK